MRFVSLLFNLLVFDREVVLTSSIVVVKKVKLASSTNSEGVTLTSSIITLCEEWESSFLCEGSACAFRLHELVTPESKSRSQDAGLGNVTGQDFGLGGVAVDAYCTTV
jgi:hypothetical protein